MSGRSGGKNRQESLRGGASEAINVMRGDYLCNSNYHHWDCCKVSLETIFSLIIAFEVAKLIDL